MSYNLKNAKLFPWWCNKVLPLVYDDSLSYYEVLCKIMETLKDLIEVEELQNNAITDLDHRATSLEGRMDTAENDIDNLEGRMDTAESDIDALEGRMDTAESDIDGLEGRMTTAEGDIDSLEGRMTTAESDIDGLEGRMTTAEGDIDSLEGRMTTAEGDIDAVEGRMTTAEGDIDTLEDRMTTAEGDIDGLEGRMTTAEGDIDNIEDNVHHIIYNDLPVINGRIDGITPENFFSDNTRKSATNYVTTHNTFGNNLVSYKNAFRYGGYYDYDTQTNVAGEYWQTEKTKVTTGEKYYLSEPYANTHQYPVAIYLFNVSQDYVRKLLDNEITWSSAEENWNFTIPDNIGYIVIVFRTYSGAVEKGRLWITDYGYYNKDSSSPELLRDTVTEILSNFAPTFSPSENVNSGDYRVIRGKIYRFNQNYTAGTTLSLSTLTEMSLKDVITSVTALQNQLNNYTLSLPLTQTQYDALATKDPNTLYPIVG